MKRTCGAFTAEGKFLEVTELDMDWLREAAQHVEQIEALLLAKYQLTRAQLDALWTYVGHKGERGGT